MAAQGARQTRTERFRLVNAALIRADAVHAGGGIVVKSPQGEAFTLHHGVGAHRRGAPAVELSHKGALAQRGVAGLNVGKAVEIGVVLAPAALHAQDALPRGGDDLLRGEVPADPLLQAQAL